MPLVAMLADLQITILVQLLPMEQKLHQIQ